MFGDELFGICVEFLQGFLTRRVTSRGSGRAEVNRPDP